MVVMVMNREPETRITGITEWDDRAGRMVWRWGREGLGERRGGAKRSERGVANIIQKNPLPSLLRCLETGHKQFLT